MKEPEFMSDNETKESKDFRVLMGQILDNTSDDEVLTEVCKVFLDVVKSGANSYRKDISALIYAIECLIQCEELWVAAAVMQVMVMRGNNHERDSVISLNKCIQSKLL